MTEQTFEEKIAARRRAIEARSQEQQPLTDHERHRIDIEETRAMLATMTLGERLRFKQGYYP